MRLKENWRIRKGDEESLVPDSSNLFDESNNINKCLLIVVPKDVKTRCYPKGEHANNRIQK